MSPGKLPAILSRLFDRFRMNPFAPDRLRHVAPSGRILAAASAAALLVPLVTARCLSPESAGYGTHRQLGLPPCTIVAFWSARCPACGLTTAWSHVVRGRTWAGARANLGGVLSALMAMGAIGGLAWTALLGRRPRWLPGLNGAAWLLAGIAAIAATDWTVRILLE